jgi:hypothetical protein
MSYAFSEQKIAARVFSLARGHYATPLETTSADYKKGL